MDRDGWCPYISRVGLFVVCHEFIEDVGVKKVKEESVFVKALHEYAFPRASRPEKKIRLFCWGCEISWKHIWMVAGSGKFLYKNGVYSSKNI